MIAYFASDLIWATRIKAAADDLGLPARPVRNIEMLEARLADSPVRGLVVDLDAPDIALSLIGRLREWERHRPMGTNEPTAPAVRVIAFGPHVETDHLRQAKEAGADAVLTRGAFHNQLAAVLRAAAGDDTKR